MAIRVERYDMDPMKGGKTRDRYDTNLRRASIVLALTGSIAGAVVTLQSPVPTAPAVVITEGVDWFEVGGDRPTSLARLVAAIDKLGAGLLKATGGIRVTGGLVEVTLEATTQGSWGEGITFAVDAAGANLIVGGTPGPTTQALTNGAGPDAVAAFQAYLNALDGTPTIAEIIIIPLTPESSSFLVIWDDTP